MTNLKYSILENLYNTEYRKIDYVTLINLYLPQHLINQANKALEELIKDKLATKDHSNIVHLTDDGRRIYESSKEEREKNQKLEQRNRELEKSNRISQIIAMLSAIATIISTTIALIELLYLLNK